MWSGSIGSIPSGWALCNGSNGTPDLRDRFVVCAGGGYAVAATGGQTDTTLVAHTHTATSSVTDPGHYHLQQGGVAVQSGGTNVQAGNNQPNVTTTSGTNSATTGITVGTTISSSGSPATNGNLPPYYALAYIMKT